MLCDLEHHCIGCKVLEYHVPGGIHGATGYLCPGCINRALGRVPDCPVCRAKRIKEWKCAQDDSATR